MLSVSDWGGLLDVVISHPVAQSEPNVADTPGFATHAAALKKKPVLQKIRHSGGAHGSSYCGDRRTP